MKEWIKRAGIATVCMGLTGCATRERVRAPVAPGGEPIEIAVLTHLGSPGEMTERQYQYREEVGQWMERDLLRQLQRAGFRSRAVGDRNEFNPGPGRYLLVVAIDSYNPGSSAARMMVGYGAGAASLNNSYELHGAKRQALLTWSDGVGTSQHWSRLPRRLNLNAVERVAGYLRANP